jgi:hypothetical protein
MIFARKRSAYSSHAQSESIHIHVWCNAEVVDKEKENDLRRRGFFEVGVIQRGQNRLIDFNTNIEVIESIIQIAGYKYTKKVERKKGAEKLSVPLC